MDKLETQNIEIELKIIDKLLSLPIGEQLYEKEIKLLFEIIKFKTYPIFVVK